MEFDDYLRRRRLDVAAFRAAEPARAAQWEAWYSQLHPDSFLLQVKMVLNDVRRRYHLAEAPAPSPPAEGAAPRAAGRRARPLGPQTDLVILDATQATQASMVPETTSVHYPSTSMDPESSPVQGPSTSMVPESKPIQGPSTSMVAESSSGQDPSTPEPLAPATLPKPPRPRAVIRRPAAPGPPAQGAEADPGSPPTPTETGLWQPATTGSAVPDGPPVPPETPERPGPDVPEATPGRPEAAAPPTSRPARPRPILRRPPPPESTPEN